MRYRLYREHKYLLLKFHQVLQQCGLTDFSDQNQVGTLRMGVQQLFSLLAAHAEYEETRIHALLEKKGSKLYEQANTEHAHHAEIEAKIEKVFEEIDQERGYQLYLMLRDFLAETLQHLAFEEQKIMPELQKLCTDDELRAIDFISYRQMQPEQMVHMMETLDPVMSFHDKRVYFEDMNQCEPEKFAIAWPKLKELATAQQAEEIEKLIVIGNPQRELDPVKLKYPWEDKEVGDQSQTDYHEETK